MPTRPTIGFAEAIPSDGSITTYAVHAAAAEHLYATCGIADAGVWAIAYAEPGPIHRDQFSSIAGHRWPRPDDLVERAAPRQPPAPTEPLRAATASV
jgi:hypothetical protein